MVYTVTFNPAIDYVVHISDMKPGATNRSEREEMYFGGKGINVSVVLINESYVLQVKFEKSLSFSLNLV